MILKRTVLWLILALAPLPALAHDTWLLAPAAPSRPAPRSLSI